METILAAPGSEGSCVSYRPIDKGCVVAIIYGPLTQENNSAYIIYFTTKSLLNDFVVS